MKLHFLNPLLAVLFFTTLLSSCGRGDRNEETLMDQFLEADAVNEQLTHFEDEGAETALDQRVPEAEVAGLLSSGGCATVTRDTLSTPRRITIDYGPVNCLCRDGRYRRGIVFVDYTGQRGVAGSTATLSFSGNNLYQQRIKKFPFLQCVNGRDDVPPNYGRVMVRVRLPLVTVAWSSQPPFPKSRVRVFRPVRLN